MQEAASEPAEQTLRLGMTSVGAAVQFGPMDTRFGVIVGRFQYSTPLTCLSDGTIVPEIIQSYESNEDASAYTLHVDPRAVWSDGSPLTAAQIKAAWEWMTDPANEVTFLASFFLSGVAGWQEMADGEADGVDGLVVVDDKTLDVQLVASDQLFPFGLCRLFAGVFNVEDAAGDPDYFLKPNQLVSGPYQITEVHPSGSQAVFELNPHWWGQKPAITKIIMQAYSDQTAMGIAMENGQLDAAIFGNAKIKNDTIERIGGTSVSYQATSFAYASFKDGVEPVDDINLRKALNHAIDFETMVEVAGQGTKYIWRAPGLVEGFQCYDPATAIYTEFNVDLAKEYLAKSRYQTGDQVPKIRMTPSGTDSVNIRMFQIMQEAWRVHLGITDVEIKDLPSGYGDDESLIAIDRQSTGAQPVDAAILAKNTFHSNSPAAARFMGGYKNEEVDALIDEALAMSRDDLAFCDTVRQAEDLFLADTMLIPLYANHDAKLRRSNGAIQPYVKNLVYSPYSYFLTWVEPLAKIEE